MTQADIPVQPVLLKIEHDMQCQVTQGSIKSEIAHIHEKIKNLEVRMDTSDVHFNSLNTMLATNTAATTETLEIIQSGKGFFKVLGWIVTFIKWTLGVAAAALAFWITLKDYQIHP